MSATHTSKCLLWVSAGCDVPLELLDGLRRREVAVRQVHDAPSVMATLAVEGAKVLVLVEPSVLRNVERLVKAVRRYHDVSIWRYQRGATPALGTWMAAPSPKAPNASFSETRQTPGETPQAPRRSDESKPQPPQPQTPKPETFDPPTPDPQTRTPQPQTEDDSPLLSEAELAMLLNDDDRQEADGT